VFHGAMLKRICQVFLLVFSKGKTQRWWYFYIRLKIFIVENNRLFFLAYCSNYMYSTCTSMCILSMYKYVCMCVCLCVCMCMCAAYWYHCLRGPLCYFSSLNVVPRFLYRPVTSLQIVWNNQYNFWNTKNK
jgi:hypothetical protein